LPVLGRLDPLEAYDELLAQRDGIVATLGRLRQPWGELRAVVNQLDATRTG
jgi:hypothetical protein